MKYVRFTELNGWEKEEWHRWYLCKTAKEIELWNQIKERLIEYNKRISHSRWKQIQSLIEEQKKKKETSMYARYGMIEPVPTLVNTELTEYHIEFKSLKEYEKESMDEGEPREVDEDEDYDEVKDVKNEWDAIQKGDEAWRLIQYQIGKTTYYASKHTDAIDTPIETLKRVLETINDHELNELCYKAKHL